jgi:Predicted hydrolase of the HD superfamily (permuted catalytic motifs)
LTFLTKIKDLLYSYTWCVPSATNDYFNDISLYDHSISTMSLSLALALADDSEFPFCICAMSVSGIQSFIFQSKYESFKGAAKVFRGRSFIISALTTAYKNKVCNGLGIIPFVDLIDAGGKLTMILPNLKSIDSVLDSIQMEIDEFLLQKYFGTLAIVSDYSLKVTKQP